MKTWRTKSFGKSLHISRNTGQTKSQQNRQDKKQRKSRRMRKRRNIKMVQTINDEVRIHALVNGKRVNIKESSIRRTLRLDDAEGTSSLTNIEIFEGLAKMGAKTTSWNEFSSTMASAIICLATNQKFNFSRYILHSLVKNIKAGVPFFMFPRLVQLIIIYQLGAMAHHKEIFDTPLLTKKVFANIKMVGTGFSREVTQLFDNMLVQAPKEVGILQADTQSIPITNEPSTSKPQRKYKPKRKHTQESKDSLKLKELMDLCTNLSNKVLELESEVIDIKSTYQERIEKLEGMVERLEEENRVIIELKSVHSTDDADEPIMEKEKSSKQGRKIVDIEVDVEINLEKAQAEAYNLDLNHQEKVLSMMDANEEEPGDVEEVMEVVKASKLMTEVVTTAGATKVSFLRKRRGVIIQDPEETTTTATVQPKVQVKDKGKAILIEEPKPLKRQAQIKLDEEVARQLEAELNADINCNAVIKQVKRNERLNDTFLDEVNEGVKVSEIEVRQEKDVEVESSKREDATPLASKIPIVDYKIHIERNRPYFNIIRAYRNRRLFISFSTMLKNFDREYLESFWKIVRDRFEKTKLKNYLDDYLLNTL
nr:hypothetical protein [Tanacetum cinerariifolium]